MRDQAEILALLKFHKSTRGLDDQQLESMAARAEVVHCQRGDVIHQANTPVDALFLVVGGRVRLFVASLGGAEQTIHYVGRDGQLFLVSLSDDDPNPLSVVADEQSTLLRFPKEAAVSLLLELPVWNRNLLQALGLQLRETVLREKKRQLARVVTFVHLSDEFRPLIPRIVRQLTSWGEQVGVLSDCQDTVSTAPGHAANILTSGGELETPDQLRQIVGEWRDADRVVVEIRLDRAAGYLDALVSASAQFYWIGPSEILPKELSAIESVRDRFPGAVKKTSVIRMLKENEQVAPHIAQVESSCQREFPMAWSDGSGTANLARNAGWERLLHHLRGVSIGLALGGGAARGMAHLGVLQVLQQAGITVDRMSGTSAGALTGIVYAAGYEPDFMIEAFASDLKPGWPYRWLPYGDYGYMLGKYRLGRWDGMLRKYLHSWRLEQLPIPFSAVTVDLMQAKQVVRDTGDAVHALLESINLPMVSSPICRDGMVLVDGGILNVVPADVLSHQGANVVLAVDVASKIPLQFSGNRPDSPRAKMKVPNIFQTASRVRTVQDHNIRLLGASTADLVVEPDVSHVQISDFKRAAQIAEFGRTAMEAVLPQLRDILRTADPQMFP